ncbi:MAG: DUF5618 family protein [Bacteroidales bacterium]|nr:DUF5618 family protein [Bacteroidales bacterium]
MEKKNPIEEAKRYVANAKQILRDKGELDTASKSYGDKKYVRMAGNTLWNGCLIALDAVLKVREGKGRPSIDKYKEAAAKRDKKLLSAINAGYDTMHLAMGYDGNLYKNVSDAGFDLAKAIIERCALLYN